MFKTIGLVGKYSDPKVGNTLTALGEHLLRRQCKVLLDAHTAEILGHTSFDIAEREEIGEQCDLVIIIGGDGTMLNTVRSLADYDVPQVGINLGRLGFLADISPDKLTTNIDSILDGNYIEESRFLLHVSFICEAGETTESSAFNEVVVHKWNVARMIELETYIDGQYVNTQRSDGLIVSTPTGSTAYALSGGGPLVHPSMNAIILVPICPHTMSHRPLVVNGNSRIEIVVSKTNQEDAQVTCDGQVNFNLLPGDKAVITKMDKPVRLLHPEDYNYYEILRAKLHWSKKLST